MVSTETELKADVRQFTGYTSTQVLSDNGLDTAYRSAKRHITVEKDIDPGYEWYNTEFPERQDALFWMTCLFTKVQTGELDSQDLQIGALNADGLLAKAGNDVTMWYRNAMGALRSIRSGNIFQSAQPARGDREYEAPTFNRENSGSSNDDVSL